MRGWWPGRTSPFGHGLRVSRFGCPETVTGLDGVSLWTVQAPGPARVPRPVAGIAFESGGCCNGATMTEAVTESRAHELLKMAEGRQTPARLAVLEILLDSATALSHHEIENAIERRSLDVDRVTLYRVLDWLVERHLAHRIAAEDRVWRFNAVDRVHAADHAHFHCTRCGQIFCLNGGQSVNTFAVPDGYRPERAEITIHGRCPGCAG
jgi:Fur family transcriptional regulator, ferric uptake regulator